jgi:hypothetical protein
MKLKHFLFGILIILVLGVVFSIYSYTIPGIFFTGIAGGIYIGIKQKRPMAKCLYNGLLVSLPTSVLFLFYIVPFLWFYHGYRYGTASFGIFFLLITLVTIFVIGLVGGPLGGILVGLFYHYWSQDRGEKEFYDSYIEGKTKEDDKSKRQQEINELME